MCICVCGNYAQYHFSKIKFIFQYGKFIFQNAKFIFQKKPNSPIPV